MSPLIAIGVLVWRCSSSRRIRVKSNQGIDIPRSPKGKCQQSLFTGIVRSPAIAGGDFVRKRNVEHH